MRARHERMYFRRSSDGREYFLLSGAGLGRVVSTKPQWVREVPGPLEKAALLRELAIAALISLVILISLTVMVSQFPVPSDYFGLLVGGVSFIWSLGWDAVRWAWLKRRVQAWPRLADGQAMPDWGMPPPQQSSRKA